MILMYQKKSFLDFVWVNKAMIFDTHIHLNDDCYNNDLDKIIKEANEIGINKFLCIGFDLNSSKKAVQIAKNFTGVFSSVGIIPTERKQYNNNSIIDLEKIIKEGKKIKAIGEIGLDYYWEKEDYIKETQKKMFIEQINLANKFNLPISIHARDSLHDVLEILKSHPVKQSGIMHCYSGSLEMAREFVKLGYKIAFGGVLTFKNSRIVKEVFKGLNLEDVVFETDAPYLSPEPYRGKTNMPKYILNSLKYAADLRNIELNKLEEQTYLNSLNILHVEKNEN